MAMCLARGALVGASQDTLPRSQWQGLWDVCYDLSRRFCDLGAHYPLRKPLGTRLGLFATELCVHAGVVLKASFYQWLRLNKNVSSVCFSFCSVSSLPCVAINACEISNGGCSAKADCKRTIPGSRVCVCKAGYTGDGIVCLGPSAA